MSDERSATAIDRRLGQRVRARRLEMGMSQERLAFLLGVTFQQVQKYEKGKNRIAASRLFDIASALEIPVNGFFEGLAPTKGDIGDNESGAIERALATTEGHQLMTSFAAIESLQVRKRLIGVVQALADVAADDKE
jgi:transcriptional regulator with XRE-family HTH domain